MVYKVIQIKPSLQLGEGGENKILLITLKALNCSKTDEILDERLSGAPKPLLPTGYLHIPRQTSGSERKEIKA